MEKLSIELKNCYGIKALKHTFDFTRYKAFVVYASNGIMKTSFAKTFKDFNPKDYYDSTKKSELIAKDENDNNLNQQEVFVIESYDATYKPSTDKVAKLLVDEANKTKYDSIVNKISSKRDEISNKLKDMSGISEDAQSVISNDIISNNDPSEFLNCLLSLKHDITNLVDPNLSHLQYSKIFNEKTEKILNDEKFRKNLSDYIVKYNELISKSTFFMNGVFDDVSASSVLKNLQQNKFFDAQHKVFLRGKIEITTSKELEDKIQQEKDSILTDKALVKLYNDITTKLDKNDQLREFAKYIKDNQIILEKLEKPALFKRNLWLSYLFQSKDLYKEFCEVYESCKPEIDKIRNEIKTQTTKWENVVAKFNDRFEVPFTLDIENKADAILSEDVPSIRFLVEDRIVEEKDLMKALSMGERRALYLLNVIFEIEGRKELNQKTLFIIDDIADSCDYQNKYAIVEYLKDILEEQNQKFYQIILTHNYDFYRTISKRMMHGSYDVMKNYKLQAIKTENGIELKSDKYQNNPFETWKKCIKQEKYLVASIPFIRNLIEYALGESDDKYLKLTSLLHIKNNSPSITIKDFLDIAENVANIKRPTNFLETKNMIDLIYDIATEILQNPNNDMELEDKIVLSIAIRLKSESFIQNKINDQNYVDGINGNQTYTLIKRYKKDFANEVEKISLLEKVNLMTPENIHLNSFMYEPILDMSGKKLKELYQEVSKLI